jgi:hypothetical protein
MTISIDVKAFLHRKFGEDPIEVRRFSFSTTDGSLSFIEFTSRVASVFSQLKKDQLKIHWKDEDGDHILISCEEELSLALSNRTGDLF